jgi:hypothetical protein
MSRAVHTNAFSAWRALAGLVAGLAAGLAPGCNLRPPFVVLTVEDPNQITAGYATVAVGLSPEDLTPVSMPARGFPTTIIITAKSTGEKEVWVEARDENNAAVARGHAAARFARQGTPAATLRLESACAADIDCRDELFCNGSERCLDGTCHTDERPCSSGLACVHTNCIELGNGNGTCNLTVDHSVCPMGEYCNPAMGCAPGQGCLAPEDCQDGFVCNGEELCVNIVCAPGQSPIIDDGNPCTVDGCNEVVGVFHELQPASDGDECTTGLPTREICLAAAGGCVVSACGDGLVDTGASPPEACDDGSANSDSWSPTRHCNAQCSGWAPFCGDGRLDSGDETCDDGDARDTANGCAADCQRNDACGDGVVQSLFEQCDDGDADACNGCRPDCSRGCICAAPGACLGSKWCDQGACVDCSIEAHCGPTCTSCSGLTPTCASASLGCVCDADPAPRGSCGIGTYCDGTSCVACDNTGHCGQECIVCDANAPICGGVEIGCVTTNCSGKRDFILCQEATTPDRSFDICMAGVCMSPGCGASSCFPSGPSYARADIDATWRYPDDDQRTCYNDTVAMGCSGLAGTATCASVSYCGQDAEYGWDKSHPADARFLRTNDVTDEPMVTDNITGLMWQGCLAGNSGPLCVNGGYFQKTWSDSLAYCDELVWGGYHDWRLPDRHELLSIVDFGVLYSAAVGSIDASAFPRTPGIVFWVSLAGNPNYPWRLDFSGGYSDSASHGGLLAIRCVRRLPIAGPLVTRFVRTEPVANEPVVADRYTNLEWQGCAAGKTGTTCSGTAVNYTWKNALAYCEGSSWGNRTDWRLPNVLDLTSIVDESAVGGAINPAAFPNSSMGEHWASTSNAADGSTALTVQFGSGRTYPGWSKVNSFAVRCVRDQP